MFGEFGMLFLETPLLRFALLPYYRRFGLLWYFITKCKRYRYNMRQPFYHKIRQKFITKLVRFFITKCDSFITIFSKWDSYCKLQLLSQNLSVQGSWETVFKMVYFFKTKYKARDWYSNISSLAPAYSFFRFMGQTILKESRNRNSWIRTWIEFLIINTMQMWEPL